MASLAYKRVMLKISGEALAGTQEYGLSTDVVSFIAEEVREVYRLGIQVAMVIGGGNIFRGMEASARGMDRASADYMGMLATCINGLAMQSALEKLGVDTRVQTAIEMREVAEPFIRRRAIRHLEKNRVVIFAAGTGNPFFTTDSAAALRASEIRADALLKGTKVDGLYTADPVRDAGAKLLKLASYQYLLEHSLKIMDAAAVSLCQNAKIPIRVFNIRVPGNIRRVVLGEDVGSTVS